VLLELTVIEQRFNAVMEVLRDGLTVIEVAERYGGCAWLAVPLSDRRAGCSGRPLPWPQYLSHQMPTAVKTQAISLYRKLGVSSRSEAIKRLQETGLLGGRP
jgi:hypothetical protein